MNEHEAFEELLALRLYGELDDAERARLEAHLTGCASCRDLADELESGLGRLLSEPESSGLSAEARARLEDALAREPQAHRRPLNAALLGFAAGVLLALGIAWASRSSEPGPRQEPAATSTAVFARATPPPRALDRGLGELLRTASRR